MKPWICPSCEKTRRANFCSECGEERLRPRDLTLGDLSAQFARGLSSIDGKTLRSLRSVLTTPGALTQAHISGQRRRFLAPLALFFIANAMFVGLQSLTGTNILSSPLESHLHAQDWSSVAQSMVADRLADRNQSLSEYAPIFDRSAIFNAKALMILMVLAFAPFAALLFQSQRRAAGAHIVFALHLYTFVLALLCLALLIAEGERAVGGGGLQSPMVDLLLSIFNLGACAGYIFLALGPAYGSTGIARAVQALVLALVVAMLFIGYRFAIFLITLWMT